MSNRNTAPKNNSTPKNNTANTTSTSSQPKEPGYTYMRTNDGNHSNEQLRDIDKDYCLFIDFLSKFGKTLEGDMREVYASAIMIFSVPGCKNTRDACLKSLGSHISMLRGRNPDSVSSARWENTTNAKLSYQCLCWIRDLFDQMSPTATLWDVIETDMDILKRTENKYLELIESSSGKHVELNHPVNMGKHVLAHDGTRLDGFTLDEYHILPNLRIVSGVTTAKIHDMKRTLELLLNSDDGRHKYIVACGEGIKLDLDSSSRDYDSIYISDFTHKIHTAPNDTFIVVTDSGQLGLTNTAFMSIAARYPHADIIIVSKVMSDTIVEFMDAAPIKVINLPDGKSGLDNIPSVCATFRDDIDICIASDDHSVEDLENALSGMIANDSRLHLSDTLVGMAYAEDGMLVIYCSGDRDIRDLADYEEVLTKLSFQPDSQLVVLRDGDQVND